jgi:UDP:flavonoid glycosyltransferase YjiC (YdhE family)
MARILLTTIGVRGDLNPFMAVANGLRARGHEAVFAVESAMESAVLDEGFANRRLSGDVMRDLSPHLGSILGGSTALGAARPIVREWLTNGLEAKVNDLVAAGTDVDLMIARAAHLAAPIAAERLGIPWVQLTMTALTLPSAYANPFLMRTPSGSVARVMNRGCWNVLEFTTRRLADARVNQARSAFGLGPAHDVMGRGGHSTALTALVISPSISPPRPDWLPHVQVTGYCFWDVPAGWSEPSDLSTFLEGGDPVVAVSFGSIAPFVGDALATLYDVAVDAVLAAGARALVIGNRRQVNKRVHSIPFAPLSSVYRRCAAAIHHGGPYTLAEALRAGIPSLAVPWGIDQFVSAGELVRSGAGRARRARRFSPAAARREATAILDESAYRRRAEALAVSVHRENGVETLCEKVEAILARSRQASKA